MLAMLATFPFALRASGGVSESVGLKTSPPHLTRQSGDWRSREEAERRPCHLALPRTLAGWDSQPPTSGLRNSYGSYFPTRFFLDAIS